MKMTAILLFLLSVCPAVIHREGKQNANGRKPPRTNDTEEDEDHPGRATAAPDSECHRLIAELRRKMDSLLTEEQKRLRDAAKKQAQEAGKKGVALRTAVDAVVKLTDEQERQLKELREAMGKLIQESREKRLDVLTDE